MSLAGLTIYRIKYVFPVRLQTTYIVFSGILTYLCLCGASSLPPSPSFIYYRENMGGHLFFAACHSISFFFLFFFFSQYKPTRPFSAVGILGMNIVSRGGGGKKRKEKKPTYLPK
ncbi:hypothetical protein F5X96DRAFT_118130 [Biscogniauxia mediterranea]|nr:hypothetical protein F5X96DRAFT_118130 [Biscogniauxia mediterranea]